MRVIAGACGGQRHQRPLELELQVIVRWEPKPVPLKGQYMLLTTESALQPLFTFYFERGSAGPKLTKAILGLPAFGITGMHPNTHQRKDCKHSPLYWNGQKTTLECQGTENTRWNVLLWWPSGQFLYSLLFLSRHLLLFSPS